MKWNLSRIMDLSSRKLLDRSFSGLGFFSILLMVAALLFILTPIFVRGSNAIVFRGTIEYRKMMLDLFGRGNPKQLEIDMKKSEELRVPIYKMISDFEKEMDSFSSRDKRNFKKELEDLKSRIEELIGPSPDKTSIALIRDRYGQVRWDRALVKLDKVLFKETYDFSDPTKMGIKVLVPRSESFKGTSLESLFIYIKDNIKNILMPETTFYWQFFIDTSVDAHFFGGIWPEMLGTFYLTIGAMLFALPIGVISAIYLVEYSKGGVFVGFLRSCINTLAGIPSIVFGLFGLAFFINVIHVSQYKSVLAGSLTLGLLILPVVIRTAEEAIRAVPPTYKEAALSLGAGKWHTILTVILPASLPGILTGVVISMGRAAGETAPIIFTAAVSVGKALNPFQIFSQPTPALPWNIYNLCTEHEAVDEIRHVQYGMVFALVLLVLILNLSAIILRARVSKKLKG